jgi:hypothetical protein
MLLAYPLQSPAFTYVCSVRFRAQNLKVFTAARQKPYKSFRERCNSLGRMSTGQLRAVADQGDEYPILCDGIQGYLG